MKEDIILDKGTLVKLMITGTSAPSMIVTADHDTLPEMAESKFTTGCVDVMWLSTRDVLQRDTINKRYLTLY